MKPLRTLVNQNIQQGQNPIQACCKAVQARYPGIKLRWARIYGYRWAYLWGETGEIALQPMKAQLNQNYGIYIDNPAMLSTADFEELINTLKEFCPDEQPLS